MFHSPNVQVTSTHLFGEHILFAIDQPTDWIQRHHVEGKFYEPDELMIMSKNFPVGGRYLDIGANAGNHLIFMGKIMKASRIMPIEVNRRILGVLETNIAINGLQDVCNTDYLGLGLHSERHENASVRWVELNIGSGYVSLDHDGDVQLVCGDDIFDEPFDLVKIDVEGLELDVLRGMENFLRTYSPKMFIEVDNENRDGFFEWIEQNGYQVTDKFKRYPSNENFMIQPARQRLA